MSDPKSGALHDALRLQLEVAELGFDWRHVDELWDKLDEEVHELREALHEGEDAQREELGDLLFMAVNLARHLHIDPEQALTGTITKFDKRFELIRQHLDSLPPLGDPRRLEAMEMLWLQAKKKEKQEKQAAKAK